MRLKSLLWGLFSILVIASCSEKKENPTEEIKTSVEFGQDKYTIVAGAEATVLLKIEPLVKAMSAELSIADESIVTVAHKDLEDEGLSIRLKSEALGTTTIVAVVDGESAACSVEVLPVEAVSLTLGDSSLEMFVGETYSLKAVVKPDDTTNPLVEWSSSDEKVLSAYNGYLMALAPGTARVTAKLGTLEAFCDVTVKIVEVSSIELDIVSKEISEEETFIVTATVLPENATMKTVKWEVSPAEIIDYEIIDAVVDDNIVAAKVTGLKAGKAVLKATSGSQSAECEVTVKEKEIPVVPPKIGDYYYSDGTWSDGGLVSINADGTSPVWKEDKPAPVEGKTVIGIVFQTDPERFSDIDKAAGHNHGLVLCTKAAHAPGATTTMWAVQFDSETNKIPVKKVGTSWYADVNGRGWTDAILQTYPGEKLQKYPAFDWTTTDFSPAAPATSSGWYVPSIGQIWDMLANLGGGEMAAHLLNLRTYSYDITYFYREDPMNLTYNPIEKINSVMRLVPEGQKENLVTCRSRGKSNICELMSSTLYDNNEDPSCCIFWLYDTGLLEPTASYTDDKIICRPVLAF